MNAMRTPQRGFTLVEIGFALAIAAILALIAIPSYRDSTDRSRLRAVAEAVHADLQNAKSLTQQQKATVVASFATGDAWCYGLTATKANCSCAQTDTTQPDFCEVRVLRAADARGAGVSAANFGGNTFTSFEPVRGSAIAGSVTIRSTRGKEATVSVSALGRVATCSPAETGAGLFPAC